MTYPKYKTEYYCPFLKIDQVHQPTKCLEVACRVWDPTNEQCSLRME